ncbi:1-deoxy-D-xylulose-5-phosphate reductoisomerase [Acidocella aminolytica]|jgi:1-deoxy-D-xylulose-5-phosphate reductoisomerase|uniref:1-deoxy-D-xylulose 5-phosphate reductoisomerase n=1 Tax=Acidocella aminolytica 101 = DSM 11237 TaxID=1120923 RepID=A0A0D6PB06_9PROT|nr:1-deoxy-D-xylulose-5-phosphate reductoisomerase [Acidocella aminolytica]GAN78940.1 1-deoxy-D-xylulose 5-phosphate reductoisomerase [Acidocella aminolytica 101 = DSM 11237]GBQ42185.1 1-deoxy-D-xylulose 5-phosphate reductoisomerase [Acidocella aminolytica 101 = DSM 11237]SHE99792.1 1-deoxy-D-xylulose 5-phosphate reductoisomerase [Acidocella aminolytica 101 = DSM 11237]
MGVKRLTILGSTGSVGTQTLDLVAENPSAYEICALIGGRNLALLAEQARKFRPEITVISDEGLLPALREALAGTGLEVAGGRASVLEAAGRKADWTMCAITGTVGLEPTLAAVRQGGTIAFACKESLVSAGDVFLHEVEQAGATLLPVDSEHNAIMQAMADGNAKAVDKIVLTASGGPFRNHSLEDMRSITCEAALRHPVWSMGAKISIDSATMFNKGLEVIEAARLFGLSSEKIEVLVHPQSVIHGMVCYADGSVLAQLGSPDMRIPIAHALAWPQRLATQAPRLDLTEVAKLEFHAPDELRFPALRLAREALAAGAGAPAVLNAANEIAVAAFLDRKIGFLDIAGIVEAVMQKLGAPTVPDLAAVLAIDEAARTAASTLAAAKAA